MSKEVPGEAAKSKGQGRIYTQQEIGELIAATKAQIDTRAQAATAPTKNGNSADSRHNINLEISKAAGTRHNQDSGSSSSTQAQTGLANFQLLLDATEGGGEALKVLQQGEKKNK